MLISLSQLKNLSVYTQSDIYLGKICDINFTTDDANVYQYIVRPHFFSGRTFLIGLDQVVKITDDRIVVVDVAEKEVILKKESIGVIKTMSSAATIETDK